MINLLARASLFQGWPTFLSARYRPFHLFAGGSAVVGALAADAISIPLLLVLGAPPWLATLAAALPIAGGMIVGLLPAMLHRLDGRLSFVGRLAIIGDLHGLVLAAIVVAFAVGAIDATTAIIAVTLTVTIGQMAGSLAGATFVLWSSVVLEDRERRLVLPRLGALGMLVSTVMLVPAALLVELGLGRMGWPSLPCRWLSVVWADCSATSP